MNYNGSALYKNSIAGGTAGLMSLITVYPSEYVKVRFQTSAEHNITGIIKNTYTQNGLRGFYTGMSSLVGAAIPRAALKYTSFEIYRYKFKTETETPVQKRLRDFGAGTLSGFTTTALCSLPSDNTKVAGIYLSSQNKPAGLWNSCKWIYTQNNGIPGFYRGFVPTSIKESIAYGFRFLIYNYVIDTLSQGRDKKSTLHTFIAGAVSGSGAALINNPLDVVATNMQSNNYKKGTKPLSFINCTKQIYKQHKLKYFYRGTLIRTIRTVPGMGVNFLVYEKVCSLLNLN